MEAPDRHNSAGRPDAQAATGGLRCFQATGTEPVAIRQSRPQRLRGRSKRRLRCAACGQTVTDEAQRIAMRGSHLHRCTNPAGYTYGIGCFRNAPGCGHVGELTAAYTWFAGYRWQVALCGGCGEHLGWRYRDSGSEGFYGLITARLIPEQ
ncbi:MAG: cereblon family protein [Chromatiales bacterium]